MSGYLNFLKFLTDSQQRDEIQQLLELRSQRPLAENMLKHPTVVEFSELFGFKIHWKLAKKEFEIGSPSFSDDLCSAPVSLRYENLIHYRGWTTSNLEYHLVVNGLVYIDDDGEPMIDNVSCWSNQAEVEAQKAEFAGLQKQGYLSFLRALTMRKRRSAIFDLAALTWGMDDPKFVTDPKFSTAANGTWYRSPSLPRPYGRAS